MATRFADMFVDLDQDTRVDPAGDGDEASTLQGFLRWPDSASSAARTVETCARRDGRRLSERLLGPPDAPCPIVGTGGCLTVTFALPLTAD